MNTPARLAPGVIFGSVMHTRHAPATHRFTYPLACLRLPLSQVNGLKVPLLGINRRNVFSVRYADHGTGEGGDPRAWVRAVLAWRGFDNIADGEVVLQTFPRLFGYVFNPVSFWLCHDREGVLRVVIAEVNNTFGERHSYVVAHDDGAPIGADDVLIARKVFHVSPFLPVRGEYRFRFIESAQHSRIHVDLFDDGQRVLTTCLRGPIAPLDGAVMRRWLWRHPAMTAQVMLRIHTQAWRLWRKRVPFFRKPVPPLEDIST